MTSKKLRKPKYVIGVDEVGRGPIAGPVAVGAFVFLGEGKGGGKEKDRVKRIFRGVKESKQLTHDERVIWFQKIKEGKKKGELDFAVTFVSEKIIDTKGLSFAIRSALVSSLQKISVGAVRPDFCKVLLDGGLKAPVEYEHQQTIIKGDEKEMVIALASIAAKVLRDEKMIRLAGEYKNYTFAVHKGYGTRKHYEEIKAHGPCKIHRMSFLKSLKMSDI